MTFDEPEQDYSCSGFLFVRASGEIRRKLEFSVERADRRAWIR